MIIFFILLALLLLPYYIILRKRKTKTTLNYTRNIFMNLDGLWDFRFIKGGSINDFQYGTTVYEELASVPSCFDATIKYRFQRGLAVYRRYVNAGGMQKLVIGAIGLRARVFWDGTELGTCPVAFCKEEFRFDAGTPGTHELVIAVDNIIDNGNDSLWREYYDFYAYGGIYRSITIEEIKEVEITYCKIVTSDLETRTMDIEIDLAGNYAGKKLTLSVDGKEIATPRVLHQAERLKE